MTGDRVGPYVALPSIPVATQACQTEAIVYVGDYSTGTHVHVH